MIAVIALSVMLALSYSLGQGIVVTHVKSYDDMAGKACLSSDVVFTMEEVSVVQCVASVDNAAPVRACFIKLTPWNVLGAVLFIHIPRTPLICPLTQGHSSTVPFVSIVTL